MKKYITGSNGFIGKRLKETLDLEPIAHQEIATFNYQPFDQFYFLSSYGNLSHQTETDLTIKANLTDLIHVLNQPKDLKTFVYFSSSSVKLPRQTVYSRAKRAAEEVLLSYIESQHLPICIIRPFSVTGAGEQPQHLIPTLIKSCFEGNLVNFVAEPTHDFIDVSDVVNGTINLALNGARGIFELGTGKKYSNQEVLEIVEDVCQKKANINKIASLRDYDSPDWVSTNFRSRSWGWMPQKTLEQSIKEMVNHYKKHGRS